MKTHDNLKNTFIYGGAFNPPTLAHQKILQACINQAENMNADVWLLPSGDRSDKTIDVTREMRLQMLDALTHDVIARTVAVSIDTSELDRDEPTETYDTLVEFKNRYPDRKIYWVYGSDSVATMDLWKNGEKIKDEPMLVIERPGYPIKYLGRNAVILAVDAIEVSSTEVRQRIATGQSIDHLVSPAVLSCL